MSTSAARALLDQLRWLDESDRFEAKRAPAIGKPVMEPVCALANEPGLGGGWLLLGVEKASDTPDDYQVEGIEGPDKLLNDLHSRCANAFNLPGAQAWAEALEEGTLNVVEVPEAGDEQRALIFLRETGRITNSDYCDLNRVDTVATSQRRARLRDPRLVEQAPRGPATYYMLGEPLVAQLEDVGGDFFSLSQEPEGLSTHPEGLPRESGTLPSESESLSRVSVALSRESLLSELPDSLRRQIEALGRRSRDTDRLESAILALCALRPWSLRGLAAATERNLAYLQHRYLTPLVRQGRLQRKYPDEPNRPDQAYLAAEEQ